MKSKRGTCKLCLFLVSIFIYITVFSQSAFTSGRSSRPLITTANLVFLKGNYSPLSKTSYAFLDSTKKKDRDGDGIADSLDKCPDEKGVIQYDGCPIPDSDNDGISDDQDECPTVPGLAKYKGCPPTDRDGDKISDEEDKCPDVPGVARYNGCLIGDKDGDGVNDDEDKCPDLPGTAVNAGCPEIKKSTRTLDKSKIRKGGLAH